jgi:hypothetical protein
LIVACNLAVHAQLDARIAAAGLEEDAVQIAAMHHGVGVLEAGAEGFAEVDVHDLLGGERVHEAQLIDVDRHRPGMLADTQIIEGVEGVWAELNSRPDLAQLERLLQNDDIMALLGKAKRSREPADATPCDGDARLNHGAS